MTCSVATLPTLTLLALSGTLSACTCAGSHQADGGTDSGTDAGTDAESLDSGQAAGAIDGGMRDAGEDAGFDSGHVCPPTSDHFTADADGGYRHLDDSITPWCEHRRECRLVLGPSEGDCFDGYCCNGTRFDEATCTCFCGAEPECEPVSFCCPVVEDGEPTCVSDPLDCYEMFP